MIVWEVYDYCDSQERRRRYYSTLEDAVSFVFTKCERAGAPRPVAWDDPCIRAWACNYDGEQHLMYITNGGLVQYVAGHPNHARTVGVIREKLHEHLREHNLRLSEDRPASGPGCCE